MQRVSVLPCLCPFVLPPLEQALGPIQTLGSVSVVPGAVYAAVARVSCGLPFFLCYGRESVASAFEVSGSGGHLVGRLEDISLPCSCNGSSAGDGGVNSPGARVPLGGFISPSGS
jgi:hypothetical protein